MASMSRSMGMYWHSSAAFYPCSHVGWNNILNTNTDGIRGRFDELK